MLVCHIWFLCLESQCKLILAPRMFCHTLQCFWEYFFFKVSLLCWFCFSVYQKSPSSSLSAPRDRLYLKASELSGNPDIWQSGFRGVFFRTPGSLVCDTQIQRINPSSIPIWCFKTAFHTFSHFCSFLSSPYIEINICLYYEK